MPPQTLASRVDSLEQQMESLSSVPARLARVESQVLQLGSDMKAEFAAVRVEIRQGDEQTRQELRADMTSMEARLRSEMRTLNDDTRRHMLVLHEEVVERLTLLQEAAPAHMASTRRRRSNPRKT